MVLISGHAPAKLAFVAVLSSSYASLAFTKNRRAHIAPHLVPYCIKFLLGFYLHYPFPKRRLSLRDHIAPNSIPYAQNPHLAFIYAIPFPKDVFPYGITFLHPHYPRHLRYKSILYPVQRNLFFTIPTLFFRIEILQRTFFSIEIRTVENFTS